MQTALLCRTRVGYPRKPMRSYEKSRLLLPLAVLLLTGCMQAIIQTKPATSASSSAIPALLPRRNTANKQYLIRSIADCAVERSNRHREDRLRNTLGNRQYERSRPLHLYQSILRVLQALLARTHPPHPQRLRRYGRAQAANSDPAHEQVSHEYRGIICAFLRTETGKGPRDAQRPLRPRNNTLRKRSLHQHSL